MDIEGQLPFESMMQFDSHHVVSQQFQGHYTIQQLEQAGLFDIQSGQNLLELAPAPMAVAKRRDSEGDSESACFMLNM